jgi:hypothetical protein
VLGVSDRRIRHRRADELEAAGAEQPPARPVPSSAAAMLALQQGAGNRAAAELVARTRAEASAPRAPLTPAARPLLQARWLVSESPDFYFWEEESGRPHPAAHEVPPALKRTPYRAAPAPPYLVDDGDGEPTLVPAPQGAEPEVRATRRPQRATASDNPYAKTFVNPATRRNAGSAHAGRGSDVPTYFEADWYAERTRQGGAARVPGDMFNPFGRFASAGLTSFVPSREFAASLSADELAALYARFALKDKSFRAATSMGVPFGPGTQSAPATGGPVAGPGQIQALYQGYARHIQVEGGFVLPLADVTPYGAVYALGAPQPDHHAIAVPTQAPGDPAALGLNPLPAELKYEQNFALTPGLIASWQGVDREEQQKAVMGASAAQVMANAGYPVADGRDWEWLHMIAHSMGGIGGVAPQVAANLVAGSRECNSEMIVVEEMLKAIIVKTGGSGRAKLEVAVRMLDPARHIASSIQYTFLLYNADGKPAFVESFAFNPLDRTQPQQFKNRAMRYIASVMHPAGTGAPTAATPNGYEVMTGETAHKAPSASALDVDRQADELIALLRAGRVDDLNQGMTQIWGAGGAVSTYVFDAIGETLETQDQMLAYLRLLHGFAGTRTERAEFRIVRASMLDHKLSRDALREVLERLYGGAVPAKVTDLLAGAPVNV